MQYLTVASAAALVGLSSASLLDVSVTSFNLNSSCIESEPKVRIFNRCDYPVHLWSVLKGMGCPSEEGVELKKGDFYQENFRPAVNGIGTSIKISKTKQCKGVDCVQLEYYPEVSNPAFAYNYLDVSYVDCLGGDCPTKTEGYYLKSGNQDGKFKANSVNEICPILSCSNADECATMSYILPDDRQTKSCDLDADLDFYMCGGEAPGEESEETTPAPSSSSAEKETPKPSSTEAAEPAYTAPSSSSSAEAEVYVAAAPEVTPAPAESPKEPKVKTEVVYVTEYEYTYAKRHAHGHRHQQFRA
ncbi:hypothetical protein BS50DRAFT_336972 [Corynespora cassiicola Philippines]|uniref:Osmotin, thaumatin-like protein n=1 Tax=Corynespora cassiicola Philippines TaxID=1448308 RepID=A0A2T2NVZ3_CORCC|nr:hypothetical protein BS50DRAFT_336972 [Corynespora cassiicola Philippines]